MILTLQVIGERAQGLGAGGRRVFKSIGGTIGRLPDNDWVFADPYVSGRHALIRYVNGKYFIEDTSTNGVFINSATNRLQRAHAHPLQDGDRLFIDAYEIEVTISEDTSAKEQKDPFADPRLSGNIDLSRQRPRSSEGDHTAGLIVSEEGDAGFEEFDDFEQFEDISVSAANATQWAGGKEHRSKPLGREAVEVPPTTGGLRPLTRPAASESLPRAAVAPNRRRSESSSDDLLHTLLEAAGIEGLAASEETAKLLGEVLRSSVNGVMDVLRVRERMKDELRMRGTTFKPANNNPLKFSANVDDAFHNLLVKRNPAYLQPADAFDDAFRDVRDHQSAFLTAMRLAFEAMLAHFDPARLQEEFDRQLKKGSILGVPAKLRYWDLYRERYGDMVKDADASFRNLFADEFAKAYEEQLARLKALSRDRP
jgi:type VI secretion system FHA domain protein